MKRVDLRSLPAKARKEAENESAALSLLRGAWFIVQVHEAFEEKGFLHIIMDYCSGGDLAAQIKRQAEAAVPFTEDVIVSWIAQIASALCHAHERRIIHRDVKPSNVFLTADGQARLGDFGISRALSHTHTSFAKTCVGTPLYISPELCKGEAYDFSCDGTPLLAVTAESRISRDRSYGPHARRAVAVRVPPPRRPAALPQCGPSEWSRRSFACSRFRSRQRCCPLW